MNRSPWRATAFLLIAACALVTYAQASPQVFPSANSPDYSKEPFVIQSAVGKLVFQNDGKYTSDETLRILIQSNAGLQSWGILHFTYSSAMSTVNIAYVRVRKPDGSVVETPAGDAMEVTPDISREAPMYSDLKDKQVAVKGLQVGDTLEYQWQNVIETPLIPGQFWYAGNFISGAVVLQQEMQISVPPGRYVQVKNREVQPAVTDQSDARVYDWKTANLKPTTDDKDAPPADPDRIPDIQLTTFHSWDEVGQWFKSLAEPQAAVTPAIQAKADALTASAASNSEKIHALYDFVSTKYRYMSISLGIGRYKPHTATEVLSNDYGDCKDKDTLFTALLAAENIKAVPVLMNSSEKIDPDVPSPGQFDHVITALPQDNGFLFLDTTPEVAPYGLLLYSLRDKQALLMPAEGPAKLVQTPKDPPFAPYLHFSAEASLDDAGTLVSNDHVSLRGDDEVLFRSLMRRAGPAKWNDMMQAVMSNFGFAGTVSDTSAGSPEATGMPYQITFHYNRKEYSDWANRQITPPMPPVLLPNPPDDNKTPQPIKIGAPEEFLSQATVALPAGSAPTLPPAVNLHEVFADYQSTYSFADGTLHAERRLSTRVGEIPVAQIEAYRKFTKAIATDQDTYIPLNGPSRPSILRSEGSTSSAPLDNSTGPQQAMQLLHDADAAHKRGDMRGVMDFAQKAVDADPQFYLAWLYLGGAQIELHKENDGVTSIKKAIALDASNLEPYEAVAKELTDKHLEDAALDTWRALASARPKDTKPPIAIAALLMRQKLYTDAVKELEPVAQQNPNNMTVALRLGQAYIRLPYKEKGAEMITRAADMTHDPFLLNEAAYTLAENNLHLDQALGYARDAVQQTETFTSKMSLQFMTVLDLHAIPDLASYWDTLGWVQYQLGQYDAAEKYLSAAWKLTENPVMANHLGLLYEKEGKKQDAALAYSNALASTGTAPEGTEERLDAVQKGVRFQDHVHPDPIALQDARSLKIPWKFTTYVSAEFFVLFGAKGQVVDVKFISGSEELRDASKAIAAAHFDVKLPDDGPVQIVRRGVFSCGNSSAGGTCLFVMYPAEMVKSID